jgi:hypothetical protein
MDASFFIKGWIYLEHLDENGNYYVGGRDNR